MRRSILIAVACACVACGTNLTPPGSVAPATTFTCLPNLDGVIDAAELPVALGVTSTYEVSPAGSRRDVNLDLDASGTWDFTQPASDPTVDFTAQPLTGKWYALSFPGGQFVGFDAAGTLDGIYAKDDAGFRLLGLASVNPGTTLLPYDAPVALYRFPLTAGQSWTEVGVVSHGTLDGLPYVGRDTYEISVDDPGRLVLPDVEFSPALLVRTRVTVAPSIGLPVVTHQASFLFECFGEVARATSAPNDPSDDFTTAAEIRRLTY